MVEWKKLIPLFILLLTVRYFAIASWVITINKEFMYYIISYR